MKSVYFKIYVEGFVIIFCHPQQKHEFIAKIVFKKNLFIFKFLAVLGLCCCAWAFL